MHQYRLQYSNSPIITLLFIDEIAYGNFSYVDVVVYNHVFSDIYTTRVLGILLIKFVLLLMN